jgi:hypothetical protein
MVCGQLIGLFHLSSPSLSLIDSTFSAVYHTSNGGPCLNFGLLCVGLVIHDAGVSSIAVGDMLRMVVVEGEGKGKGVVGYPSVFQFFHFSFVVYLLSGFIIRLQKQKYLFLLQDRKRNRHLLRSAIWIPTPHSIITGKYTRNVQKLKNTSILTSQILFITQL